MDVKFISTTSAKLSELAILNGQVIYLSDREAAYYDLGNTRNQISSVKLVSSLPSTAVVQESVLYGLVDSQGQIEASIWDASASTYRQLSGGNIATTTTIGLVKPDGTSITIDGNGTISANIEPITSLPSSAVTYDNSVSGLTATNAQAALDEVVVISTGASTAATSALSAAQGATSAASEALTTAQGATSTASSALSSAQQAIDTANATTALANNALVTAQGATATAANASTAADAALVTAQGATSTANNALTTAQGATSTASDALVTAQGATATASSALDTANAATSTASDALDVANGATSTASEALATANAATVTASDALDTANAATSLADACASSVVSLDSRIIALERLADVALISALPSTAG